MEGGLLKMIIPKNKQGKVSSGKIMNIVYIVLFSTVLLSMLPTLLPTVIEAFYNLTAEMALLTTELGTGPTTFISNVPTYVGWFWVIGPLLLGISIALGVFGKNKGRM